MELMGLPELPFGGLKEADALSSCRSVWFLDCWTIGSWSRSQQGRAGNPLRCFGADAVFNAPAQLAWRLRGCGGRIFVGGRIPSRASWHGSMLLPETSLRLFF